MKIQWKVPWYVTIVGGWLAFVGGLIIFAQFQ